MSKATAGVIAAVLVIAAGVGFMVTQNKPVESNNTTNQTTSPQETDNSPNDTQAANPASTTTSSDTAATEQKVNIQNQTYSPAKITIKAGTKVTWTNQDGVQHDVMPDQNYGDAFVASEMLSKGESYSFTFTKAGTYTYHCTPHPFMKGTVEVTE